MSVGSSVFHEQKDLQLLMAESSNWLNCYSYYQHLVLISKQHIIYILHRSTSQLMTFVIISFTTTKNLVTQNILYFTILFPYFHTLYFLSVLPYYFHTFSVLCQSKKLFFFISYLAVPRQTGQWPGRKPAVWFDQMVNMSLLMWFGPSSSEAYKRYSNLKPSDSEWYLEWHTVLFKARYLLI